jgi:hypothetical protein
MGISAQLPPQAQKIPAPSGKNFNKHQRVTATINQRALGVYQP